VPSRIVAIWGVAIEAVCHQYHPLYHTHRDWLGLVSLHSSIYSSPSHLLLLFVLVTLVFRGAGTFEGARGNVHGVLVGARQRQYARTGVSSLLWYHEGTQDGARRW
jgi:hypothetical protein